MSEQDQLYPLNDMSKPINKDVLILDGEEYITEKALRNEISKLRSIASQIK